MFLGEVVHFGAVFFNVVEFPFSSAAFCDEFPVAIADGAVALVFPEDGFAALDCLAFEDGEEGGAFDGDFIGGVRCFSEVEAGGHEVDEVGGVFCPGVF